MKKKNITKYEKTKPCPFSLKIPVYVKRVEIALLIIFFPEAKTWFLISKCMFTGHCTIEHEENVVRFVNLFRWKRIGKWFKFCYWKITSFFSKAIACWLLAKIASLCRKYMPPAKSITLHLDFHTFTVKHLSRYGWMNFRSGKMLWCWQFYQLTGSTTGYLLAIMATNKWCWFSIFRFSMFLNHMCWLPQPCRSVPLA